MKFILEFNSFLVFCSYFCDAAWGMFHFLIPPHLLKCWTFLQIVACLKLRGFMVRVDAVHHGICSSL